jgi:ligand-binding sensor domain-containing protein
MTMSAILQDREANIWVGTNSGLDRFRITNLVPIVLSFKLHQPIWVAGDVLSDVVRVRGGRADKGHPLSSRIVTPMARFGGFARMPSIAMMREITPGTEDGSDTLWLSPVREGLYYRTTRGWQQLETASEFAELIARTAFTDWMGRAWFGYEGCTIIILEHEKLSESLSR